MSVPKHLTLYFNILVCAYLNTVNDGVMVYMLSLIAGDLGLQSSWSHTKDYKLGICCFPAKHTSLRRKNNDWLAHSLPKF
jgi:hypothetical protein